MSACYCKLFYIPTPTPVVSRRNEEKNFWWIFPPDTAVICTVYCSSLSACCLGHAWPRSSVSASLCVFREIGNPQEHITHRWQPKQSLSFEKYPAKGLRGNCVLIPVWGFPTFLVFLGWTSTCVYSISELIRKYGTPNLTLPNTRELYLYKPYGTKGQGSCAVL